MSTNNHILKNNMISAMKSSLGVVTVACKKAKIDRTTHYKWMRLDPKYKAAIKEVEEMTLDFSESALHKQIKKGNTACIIFHLKTKGKGRGYVERVETREVDEDGKTVPPPVQVMIIGGKTIQF